VISRSILFLVLVGGVGLLAYWALVDEGPAMVGAPAPEQTVVPPVSLIAAPLPVTSTDSGEPVRADVGAQLAPRPVNNDELDWRQLGLAHVAKTNPAGDVGHGAVLHLLKRFVDNGCRMQGIPQGAPTSPESLQKDSQINPTGHVLAPDDAARLQTLLNDYHQRKQRANEDIYITSKICESKAIMAGDYETHTRLPGEDDNSKVLQAATEAARKHFDNLLDENLSAIPGADYATYRVIVLKPQTSPEYIAARRRLRQLEAEEAVALRMMFLPSAGSGR
jgi:hypothetical protein